MSAGSVLRWFLIVLALSQASARTGRAFSRGKREAGRCAKHYARIPRHTACLSTSAHVTKSGLTDAEKKAILDHHNSLREQVVPEASNMLKLEWDDEVAMLSQKWADSCPTYHDKNYQRYIPGRFSTGQNLAFGFTTWKAAVQAWYDEYKLFTFGDKSKNVQSKVGHYTELVWADVKLLGCGFATCGKRNLHFCNYAPGGNSGDLSRPYKAGPSASDCPNHRSGKLCDCPSCENEASRDLKTCKCKCAQRYQSGPTCHLNCTAAEKQEASTCQSYYSKLVEACSKFSNVPSICPILCKVCPLDETSVDVNPDLKAKDTKKVNTGTENGDVTHGYAALTCLSSLLAVFYAT